MDNIFEILVNFADRAESEVEGRSLPEPPDAVKLKIRSFARGQLSPGDQAELIGQLNQNRHWVEVLAREVKALRPAAPGGHENG